MSDDNLRKVQEPQTITLQQKKQLERLSVLLDEAFTIPVVRVRVGWDAIIGLVPVIGDCAGAIISGYFVYKAWRFKLPSAILVKMLANIGVELVLGVVPILGDVLDVAWKANRRNYRLIEAFYEQSDLQVSDSETPILKVLVFIVIFCAMLAYWGVPEQWYQQLLMAFEPSIE